MKPRIVDLFRKIAGKIAPCAAPFQKLVLISLAAWAMHIILRVLLLFRNNPYGFPFVSKPDWFIFHAVAARRGRIRCPAGRYPPQSSSGSPL